MKIIELLNKIANNEEVPKKIKVSCYEFKWREVGRYYANTTKGKFQSLVQDWLNNTSKLNSEVEIIEDEEEIDIQSIETLNPYDTYFKDGTELVYKLMYDKINEIAMKVNQLDKKMNSIEQK